MTDWLSTLTTAGLPATWAQVDTFNHVQAGFIRPLTDAEWTQFLQLTDTAGYNKNIAVTNYSTYPDWARTFTPTDAETYINGQIWGGYTIVQATSYINSTVTDLASAKTAMIQIATAIINMRGLFIITAKLLICIRDLVIRYR
jgi:hypothetical protein